MRLAAAGLALAWIGAAAPAALAADPDIFAERSFKAGRVQASLAGLAAQRAATAEVRRFAAALQRDHEARNARLAAIVGAAGLRDTSADLAATPTHEISPRTREYHRLRVRDGAALDRQFLRAVIIFYENAIRGYEAETESANDAVRRLAAEALPRLRDDLGTARRPLEDVEKER